MNRTPNRKKNARGGLFVLVIALLFILAVVGLILALTLRGSAPSETNPATRSTEPTERTEEVTGIGRESATESAETEAESEAVTEEVPAEPIYEYTADLAAYEAYMDPADAEEFLILINYDHVLDDTYAPADLIDVADTRTDRAPVKLRETAEKALEALFLDARALGYEFSVTSAYRDYGTQTYLFNNKVSEYAYLGEEKAREEAARVVAVPGTSEHQSGLCIDMHNLPAADISFAETDEAKWLAENSWRYGFILRYPEDKQDITQISYEPWHFRFVGRRAAAEMFRLGMCLEEYTAYLGE